jgi:hypothetical protein
VGEEMKCLENIDEKGLQKGVTGKAENKVGRWYYKGRLKSHGLTLLLQVRTLWRCGDSLFSKYLPWQVMHFLQCSTCFLNTCYRPFAASFRRIVEQVVLTFHVQFSVSKSLPPLKNHSLSHCIISIGLMDEL